MVYWFAYFPETEVQGPGLLSMHHPEEPQFFTPALRKASPAAKGPKGAHSDWEQGGSPAGMGLAATRRRPCFPGPSSARTLPCFAVRRDSLVAIAKRSAVVLISRLCKINWQVPNGCCAPLPIIFNNQEC